MKKEYSLGKPLVSLQGVSKKYGNKLIVRNIGTETAPLVIYDVTRPGVQQGQTIALVGPSGSGKSTLFRMLSGIEEVTTGSIIIPDEMNKEKYRSVKGGDIGFVQQTYPLSRNQTIYSMLMDAVKQGSIPAKDHAPTVEYYLENWRLKDQRYQTKRQLSGGQRQRVAIIEQLLCSHTMFIFDEPFSGLDVRNIEDVKSSFKKISTSTEIGTIVFSTHDIALAVEISDIVFVMGNEKDAAGGLIPGGTLLRTFNLMEMGLAWEEYSPAHHEVAKEIESIIKS